MAEGMRFTDWLVQEAGDAWVTATEHAFTKALTDGQMSRKVYAEYLMEDYSFVFDLVSVLGYLVAKAPTMRAKRRLSAFLAAVTSEENDYFIRSFEELGVPEAQYNARGQGTVTKAFSELLLGTAKADGYAEGLTLLLCAEWVYMTWGVREAACKRPPEFFYNEWIDLHANEHFVAFVEWLREEADAQSASLTEAQKKRQAGLFRKMCELETAFFEAAWQHRI
ncbi:Aminopyrimidine aminohydrolase [Diplonema papillatum]|nr:Aminopyrimidine aminohydrolase [Diplonema papillatum]|eukprot:gene2395-3709_t